MTGISTFKNLDIVDYNIILALGVQQNDSAYLYNTCTLFTNVEYMYNMIWVTGEQDSDSQF